MTTGASDGRRRSIGGRGRVVLASVVLALFAPIALVRPATAAAPQRLAGTTVFSATTNAVTTVRVPRAASLLIDGSATSPNIAMNGFGRLAGFVVTARRQSDPGKPPTLIALHVGYCSAPRCRPVAPRTSGTYVDAMAGLPSRRVDDTTATRQVTLPPGEYNVRSVTDGSPVRMTLRLSGLSGATTVRLVARSPVVLRTDSSPPGATGVDPLRNVGVSHRFASDLGLTMDVTLADYEPHVRNVTGICTYLNEARPPTGRYHPGCPNAVDEEFATVGYPTLRHYGDSIGGAVFLVPGTWTRGFYASAVAGKSSLSVVTLWMDLP